MKIKLIFLLILISNFSFTQEKNIELEPKGVYSEIKIKNQNEMITKLLEPSTRADAVETIFKNINQYNIIQQYFMFFHKFYLYKENSKML